MSHVIVKLWPGKLSAQKKQLAEAITKDVMTILITERSPSQYRWRD